MGMWNRIVLGFYIFCIQKYTRYRLKYLKFLPNTPLANPKSKPLFKIMTKYVSTQFDSDIKEELDFYIKNHYDLEDLQDGLGMATWLDFIKKTEHLEGDILELGIYKGGSTVMGARYLQKLKSKRKIYACDAFIGLPYDDKFSLFSHAKGMYSGTSAQLVKDKFKKFDVEEQIEVVEGLFEDTLYEQLSDKKFSFVLVDCDIYDATKFSLEFVYPRLAKGGIIMFDDYDRVNRDDPTGGETLAVDEFCEAKKMEVKIFPEPHIVKSDET